MDRVKYRLSRHNQSRAFVSKLIKKSKRQNEVHFLKAPLMSGDDNVVIGVDESGIYSYIGPRPYLGIVCLRSKDLVKLTQEGIKSKDYYKGIKAMTKLREAKQKILENSIRYQVIPISHELIDSYRRTGIALPEAECYIIQKTILEVAKELVMKGYNIKRIVIDKLRKRFLPPEYYFDESVRVALVKEIGTDVIVVENADRSFVECAAASIVAYEAFKRERLELQDKYGKIGSGHPSDEKTKDWLQKYYAGHRSLSKIPHQRESSKIKKTISRNYHVLDMRWETPEDLRDLGRGLSTPYMVLRDVLNDLMSENLEYINLRKVSSLNISVFEKRCPGIWLDGLHVPCSYVDSYGIQSKKLTERREICENCGKRIPPKRCLFNPICDGYEAPCGFSDFGMGFCANLHANYIICFGHIVKVGQMFYYLSGQRLLDQGPAHALIYSVTPNKQIARETEKFTTKVLKTKKRSLRLVGIDKVTQRTPKDELIVNYFSKNWHGEGELDRLYHAYDLMKKSFCVSRFGEFFLDDPIEENLLDDYKRPNELASNIIKCFNISGEVAGLRGHYLYISGEADLHCIDASFLRHRIIRGEIAYG